MNKSFIISLALPLMLMTSCVSSQEIIKEVVWIRAARLQNPDGSPSLGFAGAINAVNNGAFLVAGGANFPDKMPWEGGVKYYSKEIHILERSGDAFTWNKEVSTTLPFPIAYCGNTSTDLGIVYAGGENEQGLSKAAFLLNWNKGRNMVEIKRLPDLPIALTNTGLSNLDNVVFAAGGDEQNKSSNAFFSLNLNEKSAQWQRLANMPVALANAVVAPQNGHIYVIGGRTKSASGISELHSSTYVYDPAKRSWKACAQVSDGNNTTNISAAAGVAISKDLILIAGSDNGKVFHQIESYIAQIARTADLEEKARLTAQKNALNITHKGFSRDMLVYNTETDHWSKIGELPFPAQVTTTATKWDGDIVLSNGEVSPGVRSPDVMLGQVEKSIRK
jgi:N-acetylneuraminate epimerase